MSRNRIVIAGVLGLCVWMAQLAGVGPAAYAQDGDPEPKEPVTGSRQGNPRVPIAPPGLPGGPGGPITRPSTAKTGEPSEGRGDGAGVSVTQNAGGTGGVTVKKVPCVPPSTKVSMDWVDTPLLDVTKYMAEITCRNFILGDKLDGQVTIISHQQVSVAEAYEAYLSALEVAGYTTVMVGKNTKVVKAADASKAPLRIYEDDNIPETDNYVTQIIHLENVSASDINTVVTQLGGPSVKVISYAPTNTLIVTDAAYNIRRVYRIIKQLDIAAPKATLEVLRLKYAAAADVQKILDDLFQVTSSASSGGANAAAAATSTPARRRRATAETADAPAAASGTTVGSEGAYISKIMSDERTNSLIVLANDEAMNRIKEVIAQVDIDIDPYSRATIHVIQLNYAKAQDVATVLSNLTQSSSSGSRSSASTGTANRATTTNRTGAAATRTTGTTSAGGKRTTGLGPAEESGGAGPDGLPTGPGGALGVQGGGSAVAAFDNGMRITADENTNRLLVIASPDDFKVIERVVRDLDVRRQQVYVEAVVVEVGSQDDRSTGIAYHFGSPGTDGGIQYGSAQLGASSLLLNTADLASGLAMGLLGQSVSVPVVGADGSITETSVPAFGIALNALASNSQVDILSNPNLLCVDNEEGTINVGRNVPFPVSAGRDNNNNPIVSYQREDVGITLKVTPQINEANYVTMELDLEVQEVEEDASSSLDVTTAGFITSKRQTQNTVVVRDNQTIVLGGLIGNTQSTSESKIPILGDLPVVGVLFRSKKKSDRKTNLLIFLTPHVINDPSDLEEVYRVKMAQREEFLRRFYGKSREDQEAQFAALMQSSMNLVDRPSAYRTKPAPVPDETREIIHSGTDTEAVPQPATEPAAPSAPTPSAPTPSAPQPTSPPPSDAGGTP